MNKGFTRAVGATSALILAGVLALAVAPVQASSVDQRIETLEQELARLKQEQQEAKAQTVAAEKKMPLFIYRPGSGLTIAAADDKWEIQFRNRLMVYWTFWTKGSDGTSIPSRGTTNGVLQIRRFRPAINYRINDGFYELRWQLTNGSSSPPNTFDAEMYIHFENISPFLPYFGFGASPSVILNPQDNNLSSSRGPRTEPGNSLAAQWGPGTGSMDRGMGFVWRALPRLGPLRIGFLNFWMGQDGARQFGSLSGDGITRDGRTFTGGIGILPFDKAGGTFGAIMKGLQLSFGTSIRKKWTADSGFDAINIRTAQTRAERVSLIRSNSDGITGASYYFTPGVGWTWNWIGLNLAGHFKQARDLNTGELLRTSGWQFIGSFWLWSPKKGLLAGNPRDGGFRLAPMFGRVDAGGPPGSKLLRNCARSGGANVSCQDAHAVQAGIGLWYYLPGRFMNVGVIWDHWSCTNCNSDIDSVVKGGVAGGDYDFDTITLISRFQF